MDMPGLACLAALLPSRNVRVGGPPLEGKSAKPVISDTKGLPAKRPLGGRAVKCTCADWWVGVKAKGRCHMVKLTRAILVAVFLAVAMVSTAGVASADSGGGKAQKSSITWETRVDLGGDARTLSVTWE